MVSYYRDVCHDDRARDPDRVNHNGRGELEDSQTTKKGKSKMTLQDIKTEEDVTSNKKLTKKDYNSDQMLFMQNRLS